MNRRTFLGALLALIPGAGLARSLPKETPALAEGEQFDLDILKALRSLPGGMGPNRITGITAPDYLTDNSQWYIAWDQPVRGFRMTREMMEDDVYG